MLALYFALALSVPTSSAQTTAVCSNTPTSSQRIECTKDSAATDDIDIDTSNLTISTTAAAEPGIKATHAGTGNIDADLTGGSITTTGGTSLGVHLKHTATGVIELDIDGTSLTTAGHGIQAEHTGTGDMTLTVEDGGVNMTTAGDGIFGDHRGTGDTTIKVKGISGANTITTSGASAVGIRGHQRGKGSVDLTVTDVNLTTMATGGNADGPRGVSAEQSLAFTTLVPDDGVYHVNINVHGSQISTKATWGHGIYGLHHGKRAEGDIVINKGNLAITTTNTDILTAGQWAVGIDAKSEGSDGDVTVNMTGGSITTAGSHASGIRGVHGADFVTADEKGSLIITVTNGDIETTHSTGDQAHGIEAHSNTGGAGHIDVNLENTTITSRGHGIYARRSTTLPTPGLGNTEIDVTGGSITTTGGFSHGIFADQQEPGDVMVNLQRQVVLTVEGGSAIGIYARHESTGNIRLGTTDRSGIVTNGRTAHGLYGYHTATGDINIDARGGSSITTKGITSYGLLAYHVGTDDINIDLRDHAITTEGSSAHGVYGYHTSAGPGDTNIYATGGGSTTTKGQGGVGLYGRHTGTGHVTIDVGNYAITTEAGPLSNPTSFNFGI